MGRSWSMYALTLILPVSAAEPACGPELDVAQDPGRMASTRLSNRNEPEGQSPPCTIRPWGIWGHLPLAT